MLLESNKNTNDNSEKEDKPKKYCDKNSNLNNELNPFINASNNIKEVDNDNIITDKSYFNEEKDKPVQKL